LSLVRNGRWWQPDLPRLDAVVFRAVPDESARAALLRDGTIDVGLFADPARLAVFAEESRRGTVQHLVDPSGETPELVLALQTDRAPFDDPVARQAMGQAVDRDALADDVFSGQYPAAEGPYSEGARWYGRAPWPLHDVPRARETVEVYTKDHGEALRLRLLAAPSALTRDLVDALARQLAEAGIQVEPEWAEPDQVARRVVAGQFEAALISGFGGWHPDQDEPVLRGFVAGSVPAAGAPEDAPPPLPLPPPDPATPPWAANLTRFRSEVIDGALDTARTSTDITKQAEQYTSIQETLAREAPYVFLVHEERAVVARPGVADLQRWTTPAGTPGISQFRGTVALAQVWLRP
jgi:glutathione transport system substrate-binding protein